MCSKCYFQNVAGRFDLMGPFSIKRWSFSKHFHDLQVTLTDLTSTLSASIITLKVSPSTVTASVIPLTP